MLKVAICGVEINLLRGLSLLAQVVYLLGLRVRVDFGTGIAGGWGERRITREELRTVAEFVPDAHSSRRHWKPTLDKIRAALKELIRRGLIVDAGCSRSGGLIFFLPHVLRDESVKNQNPRKSPRKSTIEDGQFKHSVINGLGSDPMGQSPRKNTTKSPLPSGLKNNTDDDDSRAGAHARDGAVVGEGELAKMLRARYVDVTSTHPDLREWVRRGVSADLALEAVDIASEYKAGQRIPARYLGKIIEHMLDQRDQPAAVRGRNETSNRVPGHRVSQTERVRRENIEYLRRIGDFSELEWETHCREIGETGRADPFATADGNVVDADGGDLSAPLGSQDGHGRVIDFCDVAKRARRRER